MKNNNYKDQTVPSNFDNPSPPPHKIDRDRCKRSIKKKKKKDTRINLKIFSKKKLCSKLTSLTRGLFESISTSIFRSRDEKKNNNEKDENKKKEKKKNKDEKERNKKK